MSSLSLESDVPVVAPFHAGEIAVQQRLNVHEQMAATGAKAIRSYMPDQHRTFFELLPMLLLGSVDEGGQPWASVLTAPPGFAGSPDPRHLLVRALPRPGDPLAANLKEGASLGLLGIELPTRRRNRMNGWARNVGAEGFEIEVKQSFGNCPKYIQTRTPHFVDTPTRDGNAIVQSTSLTPRMREMIARADTYFIATAYPDQGRAADGTEERGSGVDVSHRGGKAGFVHVDGDTLTAPEFAGNNFFNTTGNIVAYPRAGLLFIDFETGDLLQLAVDAEVIWDGAAVASFAGAQRLLRYRLRSALLAPAALPLRWGEVGVSPFLEPMGNWDGVPCLV